MFTAVCIKFRNLITAQFILLLNSNNSEKPFVVNEILDTGIIFRNLHLLSLAAYHFFFPVSGVTINVESMGSLLMVENNKRTCGLPKISGSMSI